VNLEDVVIWVWRVTKIKMRNSHSTFEEASQERIDVWAFQEQLFPETAMLVWNGS
jgi:hypothetical protein